MEQYCVSNNSNSAKGKKSHPAPGETKGGKKAIWDEAALAWLVGGCLQVIDGTPLPSEYGISRCHSRRWAYSKI